ncbi:hypothetical protein E2C01_009107 [Portunus trituberculatus]|uniref:Uncharacterized protein n=1 Tax=Portunus trituberculatus TaxID=210409 RepID=A0A5B7D4J9_PORTR|nr:hypothetical protein [Portunus trituberculatus]
MPHNGRSLSSSFTKHHYISTTFSNNHATYTHLYPDSHSQAQSTVSLLLLLVLLSPSKRTHS